MLDSIVHLKSFPTFSKSHQNLSQPAAAADVSEAR